MSEIKVSESSIRKENISYIYHCLDEVINRLNVKVEFKNSKNRSEIKFDVISEYKDLFVMELEDKIADVISVNYKYNYFFKNVKVNGLKGEEYELLITSLISADIDEDKRYIFRKLKNYEEYSIDGIFNFRMKPLKEKWKEIAGYIPSNFNATQLKDFISYLIKDKQSKKVYYENGKVYDKRFIPLNKKALICLNGENLGVVKEVLLSGAGSLEIGSPLPIEDEKYLKDFYGSKIYFSESYQ